MYISHEKTLRILTQHGITPIQETGVDKYGNELTMSSFYYRFSKCDDYILEHVMAWLGY